MDYLIELEKYKDIKDVKGLVDEVRKLRSYYFAGDYVSMNQFIDTLTRKYFTETFFWNLTNNTMPTNPNESYTNAESFLRLKGYTMLLQKGIKIQNQLNQQELNIIKNWIKSSE